MTFSARESRLAQRLEALYQAYGPETSFADPIVFLSRYPRPEDQEVAGWIASALAYGRVETILASVGAVLDALGPRPAEALDAIGDFRVFALDRLGSFRHRFHGPLDVAVLLFAIARAREQSGSLRGFFERELRTEERDVGGLLSRAVSRLLALDYRSVLGRRDLAGNSPARFFFPDPSSGSACKRWNLYLRWMVRHDRLDLGLWRGIPTERLVIPTDTHIHLVARRLGLTRRRTANWKTAREITDRLARFDPKDPVRFDYALCRIGIFGVCQPDLRRSRCPECVVAEACPAGRRKLSALLSRPPAGDCSIAGAAAPSLSP